MGKLKFEKIGDIHYRHPYIGIYLQDDDSNPFMEICINDNDVPGFTIYKNNRDVNLSLDDWVQILDYAKSFWSKEMGRDMG